MQTLYILGNGFDLAHGIETRYADFRKYLEENHESFLKTFEEMYFIQRLDDTEPWYTEEAQKKWNESVLEDLWWSFEEKIGHPDVEGMHGIAYSLVDTMPAEGILDTMDSYWKEQYGFVNELQHYVLEWIESIDVSNAICKKEELVNNKNDLFMSFNYTSTLESVYGIDYVFHIHGGVSSCCKQTPIMGHGNKYIIDHYRRKAKEAQNQFIEWYESICNATADFCESMYKDTDFIIRKNYGFFSNLNNVEKVVCLGISFGDVDIPYLNEIQKKVPSETKWIVYYYNESDFNRLKSVFGITGISRNFETYFFQSNQFWDR